MTTVVMVEMTRAGISRRMTFCTTSTTIFPPSSGGRGTRFTMPSDIEMIATM